MKTKVLVLGWCKEILIRTANERKSIGNTLIYDGGFCHGSSGVSNIFKKLNKYTGNDSFRIANDYWIRKTIDNLSYSKEAGGYLFMPDGRNKIRADDLLEGVSGVAVSILENVSDIDTGWDECFFLS